MKDNIYSEAVRLHKLGFAIHWLKEKSKMPTESGWTTGPRKTGAELKAGYRQGMNLGARTGSASKIGDNYLCCIDVDIKTPAGHDEALRILGEVTKGIQNLPTVHSGSGGGSRHVYCATPAPFKMITVKKSEDFEICIYSDGRQMVLPPSIHPETGNKYAWAVPVSGISDLPVFENEWFESFRSKKNLSSGKKVSLSPELKAPFLPEPVDIDWLPLSEGMKEAIKNCVGVEDRSSFLLQASRALLGAGLTRDEVLSVLTDKRYALANCALERKSGNRAAAAAWVLQYSLGGVLEERAGARVAFEGAPFEDARVSEAEGALQGSALGVLSDEARLEAAKEAGFYKTGPRGGRTPLYGELLLHFEETHPYKMVADMSAVYTFNKTHYKFLTEAEIKSFAEKNFNPDPDESMRNEFLNKVLANNVVRQDFFTETTEGKLNFKNGILDLANETAPLIDHTPDVGFRWVLPYDYEPEAKAPVFEKWLLSIMMGDQSLVNILQEYMGYIIRGGEYKFHKSLWLDGHGRNGKSTFIDILKALIGPSNFSCSPIQSLTEGRFATAELADKIANFAEETRPEELRDSGIFKNLTGGGDIAAEKKYREPFQFRNRAKIVISYNNAPELSDLSDGMFSRILVIPFRKKIIESEVDASIGGKLHQELSGIFNFALEGWKRLEKQGSFSKSEASSALLFSLRTDSCPVSYWVENSISFSEKGGEFKTSTLWDIFRQKEKDYKKSRRTFEMALSRIPELEKRKTRFGLERVRGYQGILVDGATRSF